MPNDSLKCYSPSYIYHWLYLKKKKNIETHRKFVKEPAVKTCIQY